jgi:cytosine permease
MNPKTGHTILEEEFEHELALAVRRQSTASVAAVWFGFPMILTNVIFGGVSVLVMIAAPLYVALGILALVFDRRC